MPVEATLFHYEPEPFRICPRCGHKPFRSMLRGGVVRTPWNAPVAYLKARLRGQPFHRWVVICADCKGTVGHEPTPAMDDFKVDLTRFRGTLPLHLVSDIDLVLTSDDNPVAQCVNVILPKWLDRASRFYWGRPPSPEDSRERRDLYNAAARLDAVIDDFLRVRTHARIMGVDG